MVIRKNGIDGKVCSSCRWWKPLTDFHADSTHGKSQGGRHCRCKSCYRAARKKLGY